MEVKTTCFVCGTELMADAFVEFDGKIFCDECLREKTITCDSCGERIYREEAQGDAFTSLCSSCYDYNYTHCEECGALIHNDDAHYEDDSDDPYCAECFAKLQACAIKSYNYKPEPIFYGSGNLFMGVELEIDKGGEDNENAEALLDIANRYKEHMYCKHDGSIDNGFEMVSHPMSLEYHMSEMNWGDIFRHAVSMDYRSHQTSTCGLHIHVSRSAFGKSIDEQEDVISRIVYFVENHWNELLKFSRRTEETINRWASRYGISTTAKDTYKNAKDRHMGRYVAVNLENYSTIEFRLFRGTLCYKTFVATLQLIYEICRFAIQMNDKSMERLSWSEFVLKIPPDKAELIEYLKVKRLYVNEKMEESEDM
ncbi:MAG: amidoligase family protein [Clostridia bacterium]|nr:amidoligase family protein [Clostridia bacterium]